MPDLTYSNALRELRRLAVGSVILDCDGDAWQLTPSGWTCVGFDGANARDMDASSVAILTPVTIIHEAPDVEKVHAVAVYKDCGHPADVEVERQS